MNLFTFVYINNTKINIPNNRSYFYKRAVVVLIYMLSLRCVEKEAFICSVYICNCIIYVYIGCKLERSVKQPPHRKQKSC